MLESSGGYMQCRQGCGCYLRIVLRLRDSYPDSQLLLKVRERIFKTQMQSLEECCSLLQVTQHGRLLCDLTL